MNKRQRTTRCNSAKGVRINLNQLSTGNHRQILDLALKLKVKTKYNALALLN
jgi:hypothetical protein